MGCTQSTPVIQHNNSPVASAPPSLIVAQLPETKQSLLDTTDLASLPIDTHANYIADCKFMDYYDGDTATIVFVGKFGNLEKRKFRFWGFNAKEMKQSRSLDTSTRAKNKAAAIQAKELLISILGDRKHCVIFADENKANNYGRLLGRVLIRGGEFDGKYVDEVMISSGLAQPYQGGHREGDENW